MQSKEPKPEQQVPVGDVRTEANGKDNGEQVQPPPADVEAPFGSPPQPALIVNAPQTGPPQASQKVIVVPAQTDFVPCQRLLGPDHTIVITSPTRQAQSGDAVTVQYKVDGRAAGQQATVTLLDDEDEDDEEDEPPEDEDEEDEALLDEDEEDEEAVSLINAEEQQPGTYTSAASL